MSHPNDSWGARCADWAEVQEPFLAPCYRLVLAVSGVGPGTRALDVGCGAGLFARMASDRGALVTGIDSSQKMVEFAAGRVPQATFRVGRMDDLPFESGSFDLVTGFNSFSHAEDQLEALVEARRVAAPGAPVAIVVWGQESPETANGAVFSIMPRILGEPIGAQGDDIGAGQSAVQEPEGDQLAELVRRAGLTPRLSGHVDCPFIYPNEAGLLRGFMAPGPFVEAERHVGAAPVRDAILSALAPYRTADAGYSLPISFRYLVAVADSWAPGLVP